VRYRRPKVADRHCRLSMLGAEAEEGSESAAGSNIWTRSPRLLCLAGAER